MQLIIPGLTARVPAAVMRRSHTKVSDGKHQQQYRKRYKKRAVLGVTNDDCLI